MMEPTSVAESQTEDSIYQLAALAPKGRRSAATCLAARLSGLYYTEDEGRTWHSAFDSLNLPEPLPALSVAIAPGSHKGPNLFVGYNGGVLRARIKEWQWENIAFNDPAPAIVALAASPNFADDGLLFAGTLEDGLFYSNDYGSHWRTGNFGLIDPSVLCLAVSPAFETDQCLLVGTQSGLFVSHNAGRAWQEVNLPNDFAAVVSLLLSPDFAQDGLIFAGTETQGLWSSADRGQSWERLASAQLSGAVNHILLSPEFPAEPQLLALHEGRLFLSPNGGRRWQLLKSDLLANREVSALAAPLGLKPGAPLIVGFPDGDTLRIQIPTGH